MTNHQGFTIGRRTLLGHTVAAYGASSLSDCAVLYPRDPVVVCPQSPDVSFLDGPLTIDAHCHVFNGTHLQIREFLFRVAVKQCGALGAGARLLGAARRSEELRALRVRSLAGAAPSSLDPCRGCR